MTVRTAHLALDRRVGDEPDEVDGDRRSAELRRLEPAARERVDNRRHLAAGPVIVLEQLEPGDAPFARDDRRQRQHQIALRSTERSSVA